LPALQLLTVVDQGHQEVSDATTGVTPTANQSIRSTHNVLVEEAHGPDLTRHEGTSKNAHEEAQCSQARSVPDQTRHCCWDGTREKDDDVCPSWPKLVAKRTCNESYDQSASQRSDVRVGDLGPREVKILSDGHAEEWWKGIPGHIVSVLLSSKLLVLFYTHHDQKAMKNPHHEKKNTRPYLSTGLKTGMLRALRLTGLSVGAFQSTETGNILTDRNSSISIYERSKI
jgi:hypothetical protein